MPKPPSTWKSIERKVCKLLGWERTHWALPDGRGQGYALEVKHGKHIPVWLLKTWAQAVANASELQPVAVVHPERWPVEDSLVVMKLSHFKELLDELHTR